MEPKQLTAFPEAHVSGPNTGAWRFELESDIPGSACNQNRIVCLVLLKLRTFRASGQKGEEISVP